MWQWRLKKCRNTTGQRHEVWVPLRSTTVPRWHKPVKSVAVFETMGLGDMDCYINDFEDALLQKSETHYNTKSAEWMATDDTPAYLIKAETALKSESRCIP